MTKIRVASWPGYGATHNPFMHLFLGGLERAGCDIISVDQIEDFPDDAPDIVLLHWAERVFSESKSKWQMIRKIRHLLGAIARLPETTKIVWLVHNLEPHDARPLQRVIWPHYLRRLIKHVDGILTLSPGTVGQVQGAQPAFQTKPALGVWHPAYTDATISQRQRENERARHGWSTTDRVLGYCGQIRPYKGVEELLATFRESSAPDLRLLIAGRPGGPAFADQLRQLRGSDQRVTLDLRNLSSEEFRDALGVCDMVVAPFRNYLHSGSLMHAISAERPVLTPETPFASSLQDLLGPEWVNTYNTSLTARMLDDSKLLDPVQPGPDLTDCDAHVVGKQVTRFFADLLTNRIGADIRPGSN